MSLGSADFLDLEEGRRFSDFFAIRADDSENLSLDTLLQQARLCVFHVLVEEPLVDLDPVEAGRSNRLLSLLAIELVPVELVHAGQE